MGSSVDGIAKRPDGAQASEENANDCGQGHVAVVFEEPGQSAGEESDSDECAEDEAGEIEQVHGIKSAMSESAQEGFSGVEHEVVAAENEQDKAAGDTGQEHGAYSEESGQEAEKSVWFLYGDGGVFGEDVSGI